MGTTLDKGTYLPDEGERNCYEGLAGNWVALDNHLGSTNIHVTINDKQAWNGKADASALTAHTGNTTIHVTAEDKAAWNGKADASALTAHTGDTTIHVTSADKQAWNGKQDALSQTQLDAVNSGIDSTKVQQIATNTSDISSLQSGKANNSDVVHKSGNETITGVKTFNDLHIVSYGTQYKGARNAYILPEFSAGYSGLAITTLGLSQAVKIGNFVLDANNKPSLDASKGYIQFATGESNGVNACILEPRNSTSSSLGTSANKWNVINGLEPSSLSLPSGNVSNVIDISSYITNLTGSPNSYTVPATGWISIAITGTAISIVSSPWGDTRSRPSAGTVRMLYPVLKGMTASISVVCTTLAYARFIPCQGNV